ncbi:MAG: DUF3459 domain-containing protein [Candidatus Riflebacteria bacterium]|nr:DUF3459 domain-containing protein [Candidatus Riflebacteria bacterium]
MSAAAGPGKDDTSVRTPPAPALSLRERAADWRNGAVVYQVLVDRFAPSNGLDQRRQLYAPPRVLVPWNWKPAKGHYVDSARVWSHELEFCGGTLASLSEKLDYLVDLGIDVLYLNPVFLSLTNHKYDTWDYHQVDPVYGSRGELAQLAAELHRRGKRLVLDGVFNHVGRQSPMFREAADNPSSPKRAFFKFGKASPGIDGWRLDVASDLGPAVLARLTRSAHEAKPGSLVIGEVWNYPEGWSPALDSVMNMHGREILLRVLQGKLDGPDVARMWNTMIEDAGLDPILKSWLVLDNHDTARLASLLPHAWQVRMARVLQFTLPGSPCLYYGSEVGMTGREDPEMRAPMRWDLVGTSNPTWALHRDLLALRKREPALRHGDYRPLGSKKLLAFLRTTDTVRQTVLVVANPSEQAVTETLQVREGMFQNNCELVGQLGKPTFRIVSGILEVHVPSHEVLVLKARTEPSAKGYDRFGDIP